MPCSNCDGQPLIVARDLAQAISDALGPRRRNSRRTAQYGGKAILKYNPTTSETVSGIKQTVTLVDWASEDGLPKHVTVDIGRIMTGGGGTFPAGFDPADPATPLMYRAYAQVLIGQPATMQDPFYIDVGRGQRFTASASYIAVTLQMGEPIAGYNSGSLAVYAGLGEGTSPTLAPILYTQFVDGLSASFGSQTAVVIIPPRANFLMPLRCSAPANIMLLEVMDNAGVVIDSLDFPNGGMITPLEFSTDAYSIQLTNEGPLPANYRFVFQLSV